MGLLRDVVHRFLMEKRGMAAVLRNVSKRDFGFFTREDQRMHLQTVDDGRSRPKVKVWLEEKGRRIFQPAEDGKGSFRAADFAKLKERVEAERTDIEREWLRLMVKQAWITAKLYGSDVVLTAYPHTHNSFQRILDLKKEFPGAYSIGVHPRWDSDAVQIKVDLLQGPVALAVGLEEDPESRDFVRLTDLIFED